MDGARRTRRRHGGPRWPTGGDPAGVRPQQEAVARLDCPVGRDPQIPRHVYQRVDSHCGQVRMTRSTNMEHVEVLRHMKETIKSIAPSEVAALDAAIASLSAP